MPPLAYLLMSIPAGVLTERHEPWYLSACGVVESDAKDSDVMASGHRVLNMAAIRMWDALVSMGLDTSPVATPREYFLRVKRFLSANVSVLGAQSMCGDDVFDEWEENKFDTEDPTLLVDCMPIGELACEMDEGRYYENKFAG